MSYQVSLIVDTMASTLTAGIITIINFAAGLGLPIGDRRRFGVGYRQFRVLSSHAADQEIWLNLKRNFNEFAQDIIFIDSTDIRHVQLAFSNS